MPGKNSGQPANKVVKVRGFARRGKEAVRVTGESIEAVGI